MLALAQNAKYRTLGAITADQAASGVMPKITKTAGFTQAVYDSLVASANAGQITTALPASCSGGGGGTQGGINDLKLVSTGSSLALQGVSAAGVLAAGPTLGISIAVSSIVAIFSQIFNHHAQAVQKEQATECALVPAANNYLNIIDQAVLSGQQTPQQGIAALQSLQSQFQSSISSIMKNSSSSCNAGCVIYKELQSIVAFQTSAFQDMANAPKVTSGNAATSSTPVSSGSTMQLPPATSASTASVAAAAVPTSSPVSAVAAPASTLPSWWPIAALVGLGLIAAEVF